MKNFDKTFAINNNDFPIKQTIGLLKKRENIIFLVLLNYFQSQFFPEQFKKDQKLEVTVDFTKYINLFSFTKRYSNELLRVNVFGLHKKTFFIEKIDGKPFSVQCFQKIGYYNNGKQIFLHATLTTSFLEVLLKESRSYSKFPLATFRNFNNRYSAFFYFHLKKYAKIGEWKDSILFLKKTLKLENKYRDFYMFEKKVLEKITNDINKNTDIIIHYTKEKDNLFWSIYPKSN